MQSLLGLLAQLVQSTCLTSRGSKVRILQGPPSKQRPSRNRRLFIFFYCTQIARVVGDFFFMFFISDCLLLPSSMFAIINDRNGNLIIIRIFLKLNLGSNTERCESSSLSACTKGKPTFRSRLFYFWSNNGQTFDWSSCLVKL